MSGHLTDSCCRGPIGPAGARGLRGETGPTGQIGEMGYTGPTGPGSECWTESCGIDINGNEYSQYIPISGSTDVSSIFEAKGTGFIGANIPDNTLVGGNARGDYAVDWQHFRSNATQVAAANASTIGGGIDNEIATGATGACISGGESNTANSAYDAIGGGFGNTTLSDYGSIGGGLNNTTSANYAIVSGGFGNTASGEAAYAEGINTTSGGTGSHSQGIKTTASGTGSFSAGNAYNLGNISASGSGAFSNGNSSGISYPSNINANGNGSLAFGSAYQSDIIADGSGSLAMGYTEGTGLFDGTSIIQAQENGSGAMGNVLYGSIIAYGSGSFAIGNASNNGSVFSGGTGSFGLGCAIGGSIGADGEGAFSCGKTTGPSTISPTSGYIGADADGCFSAGYANYISGSNSPSITTTAYGAFSGGYAGGGTLQTRILSSGIGSFSHGNATNGSIISGGTGSFASGSSTGLIHARDNGTHAFGIADTDTGSIIAGNATIGNGEGAIAFGRAYGGGGFNSAEISANAFGSIAGGNAHIGQIRTFGAGSMVCGNASSGGLLESGSTGSIAFGNAILNGYIFSYGAGSIALGTAIGPGGFSAGTSASIEANSDGSLAVGYAKFTSGVTGTSIKSTANGAFSGGYVLDDENNISNGLGSFVYGRDLRNSQNYSMLIGQYGTAKATSASSSIPGIGSLQIAGGAGAAEPDGISVIIGTTVTGTNPTGGGDADFWVTTGADYAEYFEWVDGNIDNESRIGKFVALDENDTDKIKIANNSDEVIGIVSSEFGTAGVIGDSSNLHWSNANLKDDFGRTRFRFSYAQNIMDILNKYDITITETLKNTILENDPKRMIEYDRNNDDTEIQEFNNLINTIEPLIIEQDKENIIDEIRKIQPVKIAIPNPQYDQNQIYIPRSARKEWVPIGLMGKIRVKDNGQCKPGQKCDCVDGIAVPGNTWRIMKRISTNVIQILYK